MADFLLCLLVAAKGHPRPPEPSLCTLATALLLQAPQTAVKTLLPHTLEC